MTSSHTSPTLIEDNEARVSLVISITTSATLINLFKQIIGLKAAEKLVSLQDYCSHSELIYNDRYNLNKPPNEKNRGDYSPYDFREPLFDNRPIVITRLPIGYIIISTSKKK